MSDRDPNPDPGPEPTPEAGPTGRSDAPEERAPNTLLNGIIGGAVAILLFFLPFSTVLGGGVAGYLEAGDVRAGATVGAIAGVAAFVPVALVVALGSLLLIVPVGEPGVQLGLGLVVVLIVGGLGTYTVGLGALGGVLGAYLKREVRG